jgi:hypothetical protein
VDGAAVEDDQNTLLTSQLNNQISDSQNLQASNINQEEIKDENSSKEISVENTKYGS